jgi:hypothetical protein
MDGRDVLDPDADRVFAGLLYLLVDCATRDGLPARKTAVAQHFQLLADCPDVAPALRRLAEQLHSTWLDRCCAEHDVARCEAIRGLH